MQDFLFASSLYLVQVRCTSARLVVYFPPLSTTTADDISHFAVRTKISVDVQTTLISTMDNNLASNGLAIMSPLEIEEEMSSLFDETIGRGNMRKRTRVSIQSLDSLNDAGTGFRGLLRSKTAFMVRNACLLAMLGWMVFVFVDTMDHTIENLPMMDQKDTRGIHQLGFGGNNNPASLAGQKAHEKHDEDELHHLILIPESNVGEKVISLSVENRINHVGHYWHDPHQSVFSSRFYSGISQQERDENHAKFLEKLNATKQKFGSWQLTDPYYDEHQESRPLPAFDLCPARDCNSSEFIKEVWQRDEDYVRNLIEEAKKMVQRVRDGIYEEYGHSSSNEDGTRKSEKEIDERNKVFQVLLTQVDDLNDQNVAIDKNTNKTLPGVAQLSHAAWDGLVRKLLHALITNDDFFVVVAGDGAAAGHGNNFVQSPVMQFHYLMEPVFDFLGMRLVSRNMAMNELSVVFAAMGGADIYGEVDLLWYDSRSGVDSKGAKDLLYKQAILSGDRVPVILTNDPVNLWKDSSHTSWIGNLQPNDSICTAKHKGICDMSTHNSVCWVPRLFVNPKVDQDSGIAPESFPGNYAHQLEARKLSMLFLHALDNALDRWADGIKDGFPLPDSVWHIGDHYSRIRESVRTAHDESYKSECEIMMKDFAMVCHVEMHGRTEWTPRVTPNLNSLRAMLPVSMEIGNYYPETEVYTDVDLVPPQWAIPDDQVDPHLISISTAHPPPVSDHDMYSDDDSNWVNGDDEYLMSEGSDVSGQAPDDSIGSEHGSIRRVLRRLTDATPTLTSGKGWTLEGAPAGFCDGSAQSRCGRDYHSKCLMAGHNDRQAGILGDGYSGWLLFKVRNVTEGIILARIDTKVAADSDNATVGWTGENGATDEEDIPPKGRNLALPLDFWFDYSINGVVTTLSRDAFTSFGQDMDGAMTLYPLLIDPSMGERKRAAGDVGETFDVGIRIRTLPDRGRTATIMLTHVYYA